jgi:CubicO group peptidase (beta-lactamase class C family)
MRKQMLMMLAFGLALISCAQKDEVAQGREIDIFLTRLNEMNKFNGTVLVARHDRILLNKGYGYADYENQVPNDTSGIFQIYSITKTFTSAVVFRLIEQGKLSLDDRLSHFYPDFPNGNNITIEHLLTHTSGINDHTEPQAPETEAYRIAQFGKNKPNFAPGEGWSYCNGGYQLLGYIIARVTGLSYEKAVRAHILVPLQMTNSGFDFKGLASPAKVAAYHIFTNDKKEKAVLYDSAGPFAAGALYSTVGDLYKYFRGYESNELVSAASQGIAFSASKTNKGYGHGWQLNDDWFEPKIISHSGGAAGFRSNFAMVPKDGICIVILNNNENANTEYMTNRILAIMGGKSHETIQEIRLKAADLEKFTGAFSIQEPAPMMVYTAVLDGRLAIDVSGQGKTTMMAISETSFVQEEADATLEFLANEHGIYSEITIKQGSRNMKAKRIESSWGLIGSATRKGWDETTPDLKLTEDKVRKGLWRAENVALVKGDLKFRLDNNWSINYGDNQGDKTPDLDGKDIKVESGVYDILLDLTDESKPQYAILKKSL